MKFFADTGDVTEIREIMEMGLLDGVTTNPSLIAKTGRQFKDVIAEICSFVDGPVSAEVAALDFDGMIREGNVLRKIAKNVTIKVPLTVDGLRACKVFSSEGTMVNVTLCFSANQALLAAKAGATFISPFVGRLDDINITGMDLISEIRQIYDNYDFDTNILVASFLPGTGDPQTLQNQICQSPSGFFQVETNSSPETQLNRSIGASTTEMPFEPVARRQMEQWHWMTSDKSRSIAYLTAPQLHSPVAIQIRPVCSMGELEELDRPQV